ncbi:MAG TPA: HEAT repeat domain-containing protein, partial [Gemmatimonadaceae bacterium]|nr:HEAT repeat domain-containing protein [Gemmatimonadaceae bacterium]
GRHVRGDLAPLERWTVSSDPELRWRATWAMFRPRNPAAVAHLLRLTEDSFWHVRNWAVRGLIWNQVDTSGVEPERVRARLRALATTDSDRTVRTEALRALATHPDSASVAFVGTQLESTDAWMSVSAAEALGTHRTLASISVPSLVAATNASRSCALRSVALTAINTLNAEEGFQPAAQMARDTAIQCRSSAVTFFRTKGERAREVLSVLREDPVTEIANAARTAFDALSDTAAGRGGRGGRGGGGGGRGGGRGRPIQTNKTEADYKQIVERWVVPDYRGVARPRAEWATQRGTFVIELYPGDAPIATDDFVKYVNSGAIINVPFSRLVPDFVAQQSPVAGAILSRDEVNRHRLTRTNVSWATGGLDTGRPGYTLGHTPQPHNEGGFTSLGRIVSGMDVVDRIQLGDRIVSTKMLSGAR